MSVLCGLVGFALVLWVLVETFEAMVLPRRVTRPYRFTRLYYRVAWRLWLALATLIPPGRRRTSMLSGFGPLSLLALFALWAAALVAGFGLMHAAVAPPDRALADSLYLSGTTFTTLGYGDVNPAGAAGRVLSVAEAVVGFGFLAVVVSYLPVLYQAFSRREAAISLLDARAGSPPSAGQLLLRLPPSADGALDRYLEGAERWSAELLESHLSFPILGYYRSQHDNQSWLAALVCALDTCALLLTVVDSVDRQQVRLTFAMARHALVDLALVLRRPPAKGADRLPPDQLARLGAALRQSGARVRDDDPAVAKLAELRGLYEPFAAALAAHLRLEVPPVWREGGAPDNWQTSAWMRQAGGLTALGADPRDDHFD
jgi:Ion channel